MSIKDDAILEILALIESQDQKEDDGFTSRELKDRLGYGDNKVSYIIDKLLSSGYLVCMRIPRTNRAGIPTTVIGYKLTAKAQERAAAES